ncbi:MAG: DUF3179 domain-containing protein, partial [Pseudomonadota bacterium]
ELRRGGVPRDAIPALSWPDMVAADDAGFLSADDRVLGLVLDGRARAYPVRILNYHEIVNDIVAGRPVAVTYCPLCRSGVAFDAVVDGRVRVFGVSGLLYDSDLLMYDRETESLWSQLGARAITGPSAGQVLALLPLRHTTWQDWRRRHPDTMVLSQNTGHRRDYRRDPYRDYAADRDSLMFPVARRDGRLRPKSLVLGLKLGDDARAWPLAALSRRDMPLTDTLGGTEVRVHFDPAADTAWATTADGTLLPATETYWFAWFTFHPATSVYAAPEP